MHWKPHDPGSAHVGADVGGHVAARAATAHTRTPHMVRVSLRGEDMARGTLLGSKPQIDSAIVSNFMFHFLGCFLL
jgi:hypothetical protein